MKSLILAVCLIAIQTSPPVPRQTPNGPANASDGVKHQGQKNQKPTDSTPQINDPIKTATQGPNSNEPENKNKEDQGVRVLGQPLKIAVQRDKIDLSVWAFSLLLVIVGGLQFIVFLRQANISERQADIAEKQRLQMVEAGQQTERIITQMKETEVRDLRAYVGVSRVILNLQKPEIPQGIVEIQNFGKTPAYEVRHVVGIVPQSYPLTITLPELQSSPTSPITSVFPGIKNVNLVKLKIPLPFNVPLGTYTLSIYVYGQITYKDAFGNSWFTNYRFFFARIEQLYKDERGVLCAAMHPDSEGNDAN